MIEAVANHLHYGAVIDWSKIWTSIHDTDTIWMQEWLGYQFVVKTMSILPGLKQYLQCLAVVFGYYWLV